GCAAFKRTSSFAKSGSWTARANGRPAPRRVLRHAALRRAHAAGPARFASSGGWRRHATRSASRPRTQGDRGAGEGAGRGAGAAGLSTRVAARAWRERAARRVAAGPGRRGRLWAVDSHDASLTTPPRDGQRAPVAPAEVSGR